ncbi:carbohydrate-binding, CenC-like protein [Tanacetum coccineum]
MNEDLEPRQIIMQKETVPLKAIDFGLSVFFEPAPFSHGEATVLATFRTHRGFYDTGSTIAKSGCWSMLKGGLTVNESGSALLYFQSKNASIDIWVDQRLLSRNNGTDDLQVSDPLFGAGNSDSASALSAELAVPVSSKILIACIGDGRWYVGYSSGFEV